jgi:GrpB-like predicted nucleotidyltransferase (UPF0157 family)
VADPVDEAAYVPALEALGLVHWLTEPRVHVHVFGPDCPEPVRHRMFRDWLTEHPDDRERYDRMFAAAGLVWLTPTRWCPAASR